LGQPRWSGAASNLQVPEVSTADLHTYAERKGDGRRLNRLASLIQEGA
jgi:hypothetical protein